MTKIIIGIKEDRWEIDDKKKTLTLFHVRSFIEKVKKHDEFTEIAFSNIKCISVGWNNVPSTLCVRHYVLFSLETVYGKVYTFTGTKPGVSEDLFRDAVAILKDNNILFDDKYNVLDSILASNGAPTIWEILDKAENQKLKEKKELKNNKHSESKHEKDQ